MGFLETIRAAVSLAERTQNAELLGTVRELREEGLELFEEKVTLTQKLHDMRIEVESLKEKLKLSGEMLFVHGLYHILDSEGRIGDPYCPTCWESKKSAIHIHWDRFAPGYRCNSCSALFRFTFRNTKLTPERIESD